MSLTRFLPIPSDRMGILWTLLNIDDSVIVEYGPAGTTHYSMGLFGELGIEQENRLSDRFTHAFDGTARSRHDPGIHRRISKHTEMIQGIDDFWENGAQGDSFV